MPAEARDLLEEAKDTRTGECAEGCGGDEEPAMFVVEEVAGARALAFVEGITAGIGESFEDRMEAGMGSEGDEEAPKVSDSVAGEG